MAKIHKYIFWCVCLECTEDRVSGRKGNLKEGIERAIDRINGYKIAFEKGFWLDIRSGKKIPITSKDREDAIRYAEILTKYGFCPTK